MHHYATKIRDPKCPCCRGRHTRKQARTVISRAARRAARAAARRAAEEGDAT